MASSSSSSSRERAEAAPASAPAAYPSRTFDTLVVPASSSSALAQCAAALRDGHVVAFPTETVYGLGGNALSSSAARAIFAAKGRPADNPLIVHIASLCMLSPLLPPGYQLPPALNALVQLWPAPLTLLFPAGPSVPHAVTAGHATVGIRMPAHSIARALIAASGVPLAAPSANASGRPSPTTAAHVAYDLGGTQGRLPYILDGGAATLGVESTVVDALSTPGEVHVLRPGACTVDDLREALRAAGVHAKLRVYGQPDDADTGAAGAGEVLRDVKMEQNPTTPGMKYRHYAPEARVVLLRPSCSSSSDGAATSLAALLESLAASEPAGETHVGLMCLSDGPLSASLRALCPGSDDEEAAAAAAGASSHSNSSFSLLAPPLRLQLAAGRHCTIHRFDLGSALRPAEAAARLFDGLRTLDSLDVSAAPARAPASAPASASASASASAETEAEAEAAAAAAGAKRCVVILVEAVEERGVGLAVMNRLQKAAAETVEVRF